MNHFLKRTHSVSTLEGSADTPRRLTPAKIWSVMLRELQEFIPIFFYLFVVSLIFVLNESIVLRERGVSFQAYGFAVLNALVLGKVTLIAESLGVGVRHAAEPLVYPILYKSVLFSVLFVCFRIVEHVIEGQFHGKSFIESIPSIGGGGVKGVILVLTTMTLCLIPYFTYRELGRVLGRPQLKALLFTTRHPPEAGNTRRSNPGSTRRSS